MKITIAGIVYVGPLNTMLLVLRHDVIAVDIIEGKVKLLNDKINLIVNLFKIKSLILLIL